MDARYRFAVRFRIEPEAGGVSVDPAEFETRLFYAAPPPGESGWLFFRDHLWRGDLADPAHFQIVMAEALGVPVTAAAFRAFELDPEYRDALEAAVGDALDEFRAATVTEVFNKYLGSSLEVREGDERRGDEGV